MRGFIIFRLLFAKYYYVDNMKNGNTQGILEIKSAYTIFVREPTGK